VEVGLDALHKLRLPGDVDAVGPNCGAGVTPKKRRDYLNGFKFDYKGISKLTKF
jgi:hypothetical protein